MKRVCGAATFVLCLMLAGVVQAQTIRGRVLERGSEVPLPGVSVVLQQSTRGAVTDENGRYVIGGLPPGTYVLAARAVNYKEAGQRVTVTTGDTVVVDFRLVPVVIEMEQVEIAADREQSQQDPQPSLTSLEPQQARILPGAAEDVLRSLQATPGVVAVNDFSSQLVVRGGGPDQNLVLLDDVEIFNPYRLYGVVSMFNPAVVSDIRLLTGGFPARYGDRLSAVLDVETRAGTRQTWLAGSLNTSVVNTNMVLEGQTGFWNGSWLVTGRRTYYDLILGLVARSLDALDEDVAFPNFADVQGKLTLRPARGHRLQVGGILSRDALDLAFDEGGPQGSDADRLAADDLTRNDVAYAAWHWSLAPTLVTKVTASWYRNGGDLGSEGQLVPRDRLDGSQIVASLDTSNVFAFSYDQAFRFRKWSLGGEAAWRAGAHLLEAGAHIDLLKTTLRYNLELNDVGRAYFEILQQNYPQSPGAFPDRFDQSKDYYRWHVFAQDRLTLFDERLTVQPGLRLDSYRIIDTVYLSPRLNVSYAFDPVTTVRGAWGRFLQSPGFEKLLDEPQAFDLSEGGGIEALTAERADHYVLGVSRWLDDRYLLRLEGYLKAFDDLIVQARGPLTRYEAVHVVPSVAVTNPNAYRIDSVTAQGLTARPINGAEGRAYGMEVLLEKQYVDAQDRLSGWISYAYARAYRTQPGIEEPGLLFRTPFAYDRRHVFNAVLNWRLGSKWQLGATFRYGSGFPFTPAVGYEPIVVRRYGPDGRAQEPELLLNSVTGDVRFEVDYGDETNRMSARLPAYHRLDLRLSRDVRLFGLHGRLYLDVINVYNRRNVLRYRYAVVIQEEVPRLRVQRTRMFPILPTFGFSFNF